MHIRKYDFDYGRRMLMQKAAVGATAGVLAPLWPTIAQSGEVTKAYPDELVSIEMNTKGKVKVGDTITANNVEYVKHLLDPIFYKQVKELGRKFKIGAPTKDVSQLFPHAYFEATLRNAGKASFDACEFSRKAEQV